MDGRAAKCGHLHVGGSMTDKRATALAFCATVALLGLLATLGYGCQVTTRAYYEAMQACIDQRGTWVPTRESNATCVVGGKHD